MYANAGFIYSTVDGFFITRSGWTVIGEGEYRALVPHLPDCHNKIGAIRSSWMKIVLKICHGAFKQC
jgi:hypothetical protein